jgi:Zn-dependent M28 family amino/carboxypeptidase
MPEGAERASAALAGELVVVGAHLDHLGVRGGVLHPGADDDASGVAVVLEVARALSARRGELGRPVSFAFFVAEEIGHVGARTLSARRPPARARPRSPASSIQRRSR